MSRPPSKHPTELELEILKILWRDGPSPVREVREALRPVRVLAYTSVMTVMKIMVDKGYLARRKEGASYVYRARAREDATKRGMLRDLVDRAFEGSAASVMQNLLGQGELDAAELQELRELLERKSEEARR